MEKRGRFIVFEGLDGSGKSSQLRLLGEYLKESGQNVLETLEPTSGPVGSLLRQILTGRMRADPHTIALLFAADRSDHLFQQQDGLLARLAGGMTVLCDRYYLSNYAYQAEHVSLDALIEFNRHNTRNLRPDLTLFLDLPVEVSLERIRKNRVSVELFEKEENLRKVRDFYHQAIERLASEENIRIINADRSVDEIAADIRQIVGELPGF